VLVVTVLPVGALIMGVEWTELRDWMFDALFGFRIGGFTVSFAKIFSAFAVMFFILVLTRFIQRTSDARIFAPARMESGLRNTLRTLIGYAGLILGAMTAIATLGFPLGNLAIVAGALSVGIGFGLQSIVNNFVSGLILLFERPIKVGDWIVTNSGEGIVKRISVRSTEIETWDWASIIVPNSELISSSVINRTHKNRYTRIVVPVGVSYSSDPEEVSGILMKIARENKRTLNYPAPVVYFIGFGDSSLDFEVRIFINTIDDRIPVQNEIRHAIFKAFREEGIEIPFPQRDLHVRSIEPGSIYSGQLSEDVSGPVIEPAEEPVDVEPVQEEPAPKAEDIWDEEKDPVPSK
ncbi:MAG: mechanosensitive ion channel domain-containing protein, partial [Pseudomonadota bacterium]